MCQADLTGRPSHHCRVNPYLVMNTKNILAPALSGVLRLSSCAAIVAASAACVFAQEGEDTKSFFSLDGTDLQIGNAPPLTFHGFLSQGFLYSSEYDYLGTSSDGSFEFTEIGLNVSMNPFNRTRIAVQGFAFDIGDVGNFQPFLDYGLVEYTFNDYVGLRGGRVRRPGGIYNHIQDVDLARTSVLLPQGIYDARWRDYSTSLDGGSIFGNTSIGKLGSLSYEGYAGYTNMDKHDGGVSNWIQDGTPAGSKLTSFDQPLYLGAQLWWYTPLDGLRAGASIGNMFDFGFHLNVPTDIPGVGPATVVQDGTGDVFFQLYSLEYLWRSWTFQAEYYTYKYDGQSTQTIFAGPFPIMGPTTSPGGVNPDAWYVGAAYRVNDWMEVGSYYTEYYADKKNRSGGPNASQKDLALSFRFDPKDWWVLKLEGHYIQGTALLQDQANNPNATRDDDGWFMLSAKTTFSF